MIKRFFSYFWTKWAGRIYWFTVIILFIVLCCNLHVYLVSEKLQYEKLVKIPENKAGLVLGTSKYRKYGGMNEYFRNRILAAAILYKAGKVDYLILSGDNSKTYYNEPLMMKKELIRLGVPENVIYLDFAGFRTLDSVVRCKKIFGQDRFTIISQSFQNRRAIFIARKNGLKAIAFNAPDVTSYASFKTKSREAIARVLVLVDVYLLKTKPRFLGEEIELGTEQKL